MSLIKVKKYYKQFKRWMAYNPPVALGIGEWESFYDEFKERAPIRYFLSDTVPGKLRFISFFFNDISDWIDYNIISRPHMVNTGIKAGYISTDERILHSAFSILKDHVECSMAWINGGVKNTRSRWYEIIPYGRRFYRNPDHGIQYLLWAISLVDEPEQQADAIEAYELYTWWCDYTRDKTDDYPTYDDQGCSLGPLDPKFDTTAPDYVAYLDKCQKLSQQAVLDDDIETAMLIRLAKLRRTLWT